jgi:hypothetical protein
MQIKRQDELRMSVARPFVGAMISSLVTAARALEC